MTKLAHYILYSVVFLQLSACTVEQRLARTFVGLESPGVFYLLKPSYVFKYNLKEYEIPGIDTLSDYSRDSLLLSNSLFLKDLSDSSVIEAFITGLEETLKSYGAGVLHETAVDTLLINGGNTYIINIAQFSLEEYIHPYRSEELVYDEIIVIDGIDLNAINYNIWLELGILNSEEANRVLFFSDYLLDDLNGTFKQNLITGKMSFDYTIDTLTREQIYRYARLFGETASRYLYDYLMNAYIDDNLPLDYPFERIYYHYDPERGLLYPAGEEDRLLQLEN